MVTVLPPTELRWNSTSVFLRASTSLATMDLGRRNSGMPYTSTPPSSCRASYTCTLAPRADR